MTGGIIQMIKRLCVSVFSFDLQASKCFMIPSTHGWGNGKNGRSNDLPEVLQKMMAEAGTAPTWPENPTITAPMHLSRWVMDCHDNTSVWHCILKADLQRRQRRSGCTYSSLAQPRTHSVHVQVRRPCVTSSDMHYLYNSSTDWKTNKSTACRWCADIQTHHLKYRFVLILCFFIIFFPLLLFFFLPCCSTTEHLIQQQNKPLAKEAASLNHSGSPHTTDMSE